MAGRRTFFFEGLGVSDGIAIGPAYVIESQGMKAESYELDEHAVDKEIRRFDKSVELAKGELRQIRQQVEEKIDRQQASIFDAHLMMLEDPHIVDRTRHRIKVDRINAESILWEVTQSLGEQMKALGDEYFAERNHDLYDVARRVIKFLRQLNAANQTHLPAEGCIIVANDLGPAETAQFSREHVKAFCTNEGGATSHTAIMAKALAIPAIVGLEYVTHYIRTGDTLILDGSDGKLILNPTREQLTYYRGRAEEFEHRRQALVSLRNLPAETTDGTRIAMNANIEFPEELDAVETNGAEGIGLFRTEFLYLDRKTLPLEEDHYREYKMILDRMGDKPVIMRTIDIGGDKLPDKEFTLPELNPFMGLRAVRLCLARPELYRAQLRAMLNAAAGRVANIMIPMVSGLNEVRVTRFMINDLLAHMNKSGQPVPSSIRLGAMVEIPSAALQARELCKETDFLSIGTNDLVQYTLAVDRVNRSVANLYRPTHPAVLQLIKLVVDAARASNVSLSVCGEMAADPYQAGLLVGLGIRNLSMGPSSIGVVKRLLRSVSLQLVEELAQEALTKGTPEEVDSLIQEKLGHVLDSSDKSPKTQSSKSTV